MDTTTKYIKMCERLPDEMKSDIIDGDFYYWKLPSQNKGMICISYTEIFEGYTVHHPEQWDFLNGREIVRLLRQDQLQDMIGTYQIAYSLMYHYKKTPLYFIGDKPYYPFNVITSAEMLWLCFVMYEKYGKHWDGLDWIS